MNLGIRDAVAAGKAIAAHYRSCLSGDEELAPFVAFDAQRQTEGLKVIRMTRVLNWFWTTQNPVGKVIRDITLFCVSFAPATGRWVALRLSGLSH
jgi:2-polyprenyl-6-methoxyphenol hydroxylase-like FAD-dependent oxidoreductase